MSMSARRRLWPVACILATIGAKCGGGGTPTTECPDCFEAGFQVKVIAGSSTTGPPPAVLYSGFRNGRCEDDYLCTGTPDAYLGDIEPGTRDWDQSCKPDDQELIVFAGGHAPTTGQPDPTLADVSVTLDPPTDLLVTGWWVPGVDPAQVQFHLDQAQRVYRELGTGIELKYQVKAFPSSELVNALSALTSNASCALQAPLVGAPTSSTAQALANPVSDPGRVNLYYVMGIMGGGYRGWSCFDDPVLPYIAFVDMNRMNSLWVTAHELGHLLGHQVPATYSSGATAALAGDVDEIELYRYLPSDNLMQSTVTDVKQITIGQIYRMHFDGRSWLRRGEPTPPPGGYPRTCQSNPVLGGVCPPLTLHPPRGWP